MRKGYDVWHGRGARPRRGGHHCRVTAPAQTQVSCWWGGTPKRIWTARAVQAIAWPTTRSSTPSSQMTHAVTRSGSPAFVTLESVICSGVRDRGCRAARRGHRSPRVSVSNTCSTSDEVGGLVGRTAVFGAGGLDLRRSFVAGRLRRCVAFADQVLESCHRILMTW